MGLGFRAWSSGFRVVTNRVLKVWGLGFRL